jgi:ectoine hydroxylase-related dioxygenase (phytanoyl-CoA dioxygenase family)
MASSWSDGEGTKNPPRKIPMIGSDAIASYHRNGWMVVDDLVPRDQLEIAREIVQSMLDGARGVAAHTELYDLEPSHRPDAPRVRRLKLPHKQHRFFRELIASPPLVAVLRALLGTPDIRLTGSKINMKLPQGGSPVEWHQDWAFYPHTNDHLLAAGVMLDDCTVENGAIQFLPGSHLGPVFDHHADGAFCGAIDVSATALDFSKAVPGVGRAGSVSFHHVRMVHGSAENLSGVPRALLLYEVAAADAWPLMGAPDLAEFDGQMLAGRPTIMPRLADVPVRMPLPRAKLAGSIYENQTAAKSRYFGHKNAG